MILCAGFLSSLPDYVYFENSSSNPYLIRRIEELNKVCHFLSLINIYSVSIELWCIAICYK